MRQREFLAESAHRRHEAELLEFRWMQLVRKPVNLRGQSLHLRREFLHPPADLPTLRRRALAKHLQLDGKQREALAQVIVQFAGEPRLLFFLRVDQPPAQIVRCLLGEFARGDIEGGATHQNRFASGVKLDTATGGDPTHPAIRKNDPILLFVSPACLMRLPQGLADRVAIFRVQPLEKALHVQPLRLLEAEQLPPLVCSPDFLPYQIPNPDANAGGISSEAHPLFALAQRPLGQPAAAALNEQRTNQERLHSAQGTRQQG